MQTDDNYYQNNEKKYIKNNEYNTKISNKLKKLQLFIKNIIDSKSLIKDTYQVNDTNEYKFTGGGFTNIDECNEKINELNYYIEKIEDVNEHVLNRLSILYEQ